MIPDAETCRIIARWLTRLTTITRQPNDAPIVADTLRDYAELLARDLPSAAFTIDSLHAVAQGQEWFPAYAVIAARVAEHWTNTRPVTAPMLVDRSAAPMSEMDRSWLAYWRKRKPECLAVEAGIDPSKLATMDPTQRPLALLASLVRSQSPAAWGVIIKAENPAFMEHEPPTFAQEFAPAEAWADYAA